MKYYLCSVSTCKHKRTGYRFCSVNCWDAHLGYANHREAWAEENTTPSKAEFIAEQAVESGDRPPLKKVFSPSMSALSGVAESIRAPAKDGPPETLVVVSRVKDIVKARGGDFSASQCFIDAVSAIVHRETLKAIEKAKAAGRKTVMGRDVG